MAITLTKELDELQLNDLIDQGYTTLKLYKSDTMDGNFTDSSATVSPATLALLLTAESPYVTTFTYASGNGAMWYKIVAYNGSSTSSLNDAMPFHGGGGTTLKALRQKTGKLMRALYTGTTTSGGSTTSAVCSHARFKRKRDNYFGGASSGEEGWVFHNLSNSEWTEVSGFTSSSGTFTLSPAVTSVGSGVDFEVMARWDPEEYRDAINWAVINSYPTLSMPIIDSSLITQEDVYQYQLPENIRILNAVELESGNNTDSETNVTKGQPWRTIPYSMFEDGLSKWIEFKTDLVEDRRLRLHGTAQLSLMYNDTDYTQVKEPQTELLCYLAAHRLYALLANDAASSDIDRWKMQSDYFLGLYNEAKMRLGRTRKSRKMWQHDAMWSNY